MMSAMATRLRYLRYLSIGAFCAVFNLVIQVISVRLLNFHYVLANVISFLALVPLSYFLHKNITFSGAGDCRGKSFLIYAVQWIGLFLVNVCLLGLLVDVIKLDAVFSIVFVTILLHILGFLGLRFYVFDMSDKKNSYP